MRCWLDLKLYLCNLPWQPTEQSPKGIDHTAGPDARCEHLVVSIIPGDCLPVLQIKILSVKICYFPLSY
jgi:hypothetical protein